MNEINTLIYDLAVDGATINEVASTIATPMCIAQDEAYKMLTTQGTNEAISYHIGMLFYHDAVEKALFSKANDGDIEAIEVLLKLHADQRAQKMIGDLF